VISGPESDRVRRAGLGIGGWLSAIWLTVILLAAIVGPYLPGLPDPKNDVGDLRLGWFATGHVFGTDGNGATSSR